MVKRIVFLLFLFHIFYPVPGESPASDPQRYFTVSGQVKDKGNGEGLAGVTVLDRNRHSGTSTNAGGFFSIELPEGKFDLQFSYIGYKTAYQRGSLSADINLEIILEAAENTLGEVVVEGKRTDENVKAAGMSLVKLDIKTIKRVPSLLGEIDLIKVIQLLPGVQATSEGASGFSVRGGNADQNLILLDEATIYNASHLMGFFSVFNNDAVREVTLYKGDIPASHGGRLSSLLDVKMKDGEQDHFAGTGSIGTISSKLTLEGPIKKGRSTFLIAGRRTYADLFLPLAKNKDVRDNKLYFYDMNIKVSQVINDKNRLYLSGYKGRDIFKNQYSEIGFGNQAASLRWNHFISDNHFFNLSFIYSGYDYDLGTPKGDPDSFRWNSKLHDYSLRLDFTHPFSDKHKVKYGATTRLHEFHPGSVYSNSTSGTDIRFVLPDEFALEHSLYITDDYNVSQRLTLKFGLRFALFQNIGPGTIYNYDENYNPVDSISYSSGKIFHTYSSLEPRVAFTFLLNDVSSIKGSYSRAAQFVSLAQNSTAGTPLDIWFPATPNVKPQSGDQAAFGYFRNFMKNVYEVSAEVYYRNIKNLIDFRDHAELFLNPYLEGELRIGRGYSYGFETLIRKNEGAFSGWLSYTWSRSFRVIPEINAGRVYSSPYDKPHTVNLVASYEFTRRLSVSSTWVYSTGLPVTFPTGRANIGNAIIPIYSDRNDYRMPAYHRLDLSVTLSGREKPGKKWEGEWNLSVYNVYNRHNAWSINFQQDSADPNITYAEKTYLFSIIPALTYNIKF